MKIFRLEISQLEQGIRTKHVFEFVCDWANTRNGFKHTCTVLKNGYKKGEVKICYLNRTWESFEYESVLRKAMDSYLSKELAEKAKGKFVWNGPAVVKLRFNKEVL